MAREGDTKPSRKSSWRISNSEAIMTLEDAIVENAVEAFPEAEEEVVPETEVEDVIEKSMKAEEKAEAREAETEEETEEETVEIDSQEEHIHGPHCNHSVEENHLRCSSYDWSG